MRTDYKTLINKASFLVVTLLTFYFASGQKNCNLTKTLFLPFIIKNDGLISEKYKSIKNSQRNIYSIMLLSSSYLKGDRAYCISFINSSKIDIEILSKDSILFFNETKNINYSDSILKNANDSLKGYYLSECENVNEAHFRQFLVVSNGAQKFWIEYACFSSNMKEILNNKKNSIPILANIYNIVERIFNNSKLWW